MKKEFFNYEMSIIRTCSSNSHFLLLAEGLDINKIILKQLEFYNRPDTLALLINCDDITDDFEKRLSIFCNMRTMSSKQRKESYSIGGVKICTNQTLLTDMLNNILEIKKISVIFIPQMETVKRNSIIAFICSLVKSQSKDTVIKAFSNHPLAIEKRHFNLENILDILRINTVHLFPRFHATITEDLKKNPSFTEITFKLPVYLEDIQLYLLELINGIKNEIEKYRMCKLAPADFYQQREAIQKTVNASKSSLTLVSASNPSKSALTLSKNPERSKGHWPSDMKETTLLNIRQSLSRDLKNLSFCLDLIFSLDIAHFKSCYTELYDLEIKKRGIWILNMAAHLIIDTINNSGNHNSVIHFGKSQGHSNYDENRSKEHKIEEKSINDENRSKDHKIEGQSINDENRSKDHTIEEHSETTAIDIKRNKKLDELKKLLKLHSDEKILILSKLKLNRDVVNNISNNIKKDVRFMTHDQFSEYLLKNKKIVIFLDFSLGSIRRLEILSQYTEIDKIYLLLYKNSEEESLYLNTLRAEKELFVKFINEKSNLPYKYYEHYTHHESDDSNSDEGYDTKHERHDKRIRSDSQDHIDSTYDRQYDNIFNITVDFRELRSSLPFYLHKYGNQLDISCLSEGDYILNTDIIIERKNIFDLIGSFNNGRLFHQLLRLINYKKVYLLIEYDQGLNLFKYTSLNSFDLIAKFCLMTVRFHQLRYIHSNSDILACRSIRALQKQYLKKPTSNIRSNHTKAMNDIKMHPVLQSILLSIPGITTFDTIKIRNHFKNLKTFITAEKDLLIEIFGEKGAEIHKFFHSAF
ncbi:Structure-specific endonuclease ERCC1-XPF, catalytic component XPF/ERCC4 [Pseudoloma neurophilia]|uniref:Structure-specific endonuclease ERCC1-XPF, catalytic component XPF/ERCC4 n=1 Tax=Pseudoloma neurophilia TaxID=146866 RepID=A0A0R0M149_9MICR|nr:Structure-specific endonuclease ERCC1-XPF, catalytic component XPF/ERCC4 [Pseudoloma neurophilia]